MATTFTVRQFFTIPPESLPLAGERPEGVFVVTGSASNLIINNTRTNLANDTLTIGNSGTSYGWWPGPSTSVYGVIVGGNESFTNTGAGAVTPSYVSCWGWVAQETQGANDDDFVSLAGNILGTTYANVNLAKTALRSAGYYYQYPVGFDGQSPNTGTGSD